MSLVCRRPYVHGGQIGEGVACHDVQSAVACDDVLSVVFFLKARLCKGACSQSCVNMCVCVCVCARAQAVVRMSLRAKRQKKGFYSIRNLEHLAWCKGSGL